MPIHHLSPLFWDRCQSVSGLHEQSLDARLPLVLLQTWCGRSFRKKIHLGSCCRLFVRIVTDRAISVLSFVELRSELFLSVRIRVSYKLFLCHPLLLSERSVVSWNFQLLGIFHSVCRCLHLLSLWNHSCLGCALLFSVTDNERKKQFFIPFCNLECGRYILPIFKVSYFLFRKAESSVFKWILF